MKCDLCNRDNLTAKELSIHRKYFHQDNQSEQQVQTVSSNVCPDCGGALILQEGCEYCNLCGYSKCG